MEWSAVGDEFEKLIAANEDFSEATIRNAKDLLVYVSENCAEGDGYPRGIGQQSVLTGTQRNRMQFLLKCSKVAMNFMFLNTNHSRFTNMIMCRMPLCLMSL
ncbi:hypothetical protein [Asticcacaulis endophyticus]|uniref:Uncharacterized protein n=1 Tax=Asticcacaulis endophyticus TaxID=1395890 RepID=A0A918URM1_9CAUL|nr:hypothetical protein [Asticcacaulis endophyticus]GGZ28622.1 hypothetical protein GCM10011273_13050 [Asticcacaulis endophyticus]